MRVSQARWAFVPDALVVDPMVGTLRAAA